MAMDVIEARSRQRLWPFAVLLPATVLLVYMIFASFDPDFASHSKKAVLNALDPWSRAAYFAGCSAVCLVCIGIAIWRRCWPKVELEIDGRGVTSHLFWGRGTLAWDAITHCTSENNWLFVHGTDAAGRKRKLVIDLGGLDRAPEDIMDALHRRRPDLMDRI